MNLHIPEESKYNEKIQDVRDLIKSVIPSVSSAVGSAVYELVVRPACIIYASIEDMIDSVVSSYNLSSLQLSGNREESVADRILSNYFIYREQGEAAAGVITIYSTYPHTKIQQGTGFNVAGTSVYVSKTYHGIFGDISDYTSTDTEEFIKASKVGDMYCFNISVSTIDISDAIIPMGIDAVPLSYVPGLDHAVLSSAIEGSGQTETDAEMVARAHSTICGIFSGSDAIQKILSGSDLRVYSSKSFDYKSQEMNRTYNSNVFLGSSGMVDTYVKTSRYPLNGSLTVTSDTAEIDVTDIVPGGVISIDSVIGDSGYVYAYNTLFGSSALDITAEGARFSAYQTTKIVLDGDLSDKKDTVFTITYTYMPNIKELQEYISKDAIRPIGLDILIKAAIPTIIRITGSVVGNSDIQSIKDVIKNRINRTPTGYCVIDMSEINKDIIDYTSGSYISSPSHITALSYNYNGDLNIVQDTVSGYLNIEASERITPGMRFICISDEGLDVK